jgi:lipid-A-disaccharide synthase-like uncharacterized protein
MQKKMFFRNFGNVSMFGLIVTLVCFILTSSASVFLVKNIMPMMYNYTALNDDEVIPGEDNP